MKNLTRTATAVTLLIASIIAIKPTASYAAPEWVVQPLTQPEDGAFAWPKIADDGAIYYINYVAGEGFAAGSIASTTPIGLFRDGVPVPGYNTQINLYDVHSGHLSVAYEDPNTHEWSVYLDGALFGTTYYNVNLPKFDADGNSIWVREEQAGGRFLVINGTATPICDFVPAGVWQNCGSYDYNAWPVGLNHGAPYLSVSEYQFDDQGTFQSLHYLVDGVAAAKFDFPDLAKVFQYSTKNKYLLGYGQNYVGEKEFNLVSVDDGKAVVYPLADSDQPSYESPFLFVDDAGNFFRCPQYTDTDGNYVSCQVMWNNRPLAPLNIRNEGFAMWPQEWKDNVIVWSNSANQIMKATYLDREGGDFNGSGCAEIADFLILLDNWQQDYAGQVMDIGDFLSLLDHWYGCPAIPVEP